MNAQYPPDYGNEAALRAVFNWQTRVRLAPKFGSLPIGYYQQDHCAIADEIVRRIAATHHSCYAPFKVRMRDGVVQFSSPKLGGTWESIGTVCEIEQAAGYRSSRSTPPPPPRMPGVCAVCGDREAQDSRGWTQPGMIGHQYMNEARGHAFEYRPPRVATTNDEQPKGKGE